MEDSLSIIIPVYGEKELVTILYNRLVNVLKQMQVNYKIIYVNDADPHGCEEELKKIADIDSNVIIINFVRNFGEEFAVKAGIDYCDSDYAVIMDCDLQDKPEDIPFLYAKVKEGHNIVWGERIYRNDSFKKKFFSNLFYFVFNLVSDVKIKRKIGSFSIISKTIIHALKQNKTGTFNYIQAVKYLGIEEEYVPIEKDKRPFGSSGYNLIKSLKLAFKILISSPSKILHEVVIISISLVLLCLFSIFYFINTDISITLNTILFLTLLFFGILFFNISIIGFYVLFSMKEIASPYQYIVRSIIKK